MYTIKIWVFDKVDDKIHCISRKVDTIPQAIGHIQIVDWDAILEIHIYKGV